MVGRPREVNFSYAADIARRAAVRWGQVGAGRDHTPCCGETGPAQRWSPGRCGCRLGLRAPWTRCRPAPPSTNPLPLCLAGAGPPVRKGADSGGWSAPIESLDRRPRASARAAAAQVRRQAPPPDHSLGGSGANLHDPTPQHPATRTHPWSSRPFFGACHQTPAPCAPPLCRLPRADWTSPRPGQSANGMGGLNFSRDEVVHLMANINLHRWVSANSPLATPQPPSQCVC